MQISVTHSSNGFSICLQKSVVHVQQQAVDFGFPGSEALTIHMCHLSFHVLKLCFLNVSEALNKMLPVIRSVQHCRTIHEQYLVPVHNVMELMGISIVDPHPRSVQRYH